MARTPEGWKVFLKRKTFHVRFRCNGERLEFSTDKQNKTEAKTEAAKIYADVISGKRTVGKAKPVINSFEEAAAHWIDSLSSTHATGTIDAYTLYARTHWIPFFGNRLDRISQASLSDYGRERLRKATRKTVRKELAALRGFLSWCSERGIFDASPIVPALPRGAVGERATSRKAVATALTEAEIKAILAELPEWSSVKESGFAVRAYFQVLWETGLRPSTLAKLSTPEHYSVGAKELTLSDKIDKARFGRAVPLTVQATEALDFAVQSQGLIFGKHDYRAYLRPAAARAGIDVAKVATLSPYDFRHARASYLVSTSGDILGVGYLLGHRQATTTNAYLRGSLEAAIRVLSGANRVPDLPSPSCEGGDLNPHVLRHWNLNASETPKTSEKTACLPGQRGPNRVSTGAVLGAVREALGRGLERLEARANEEDFPLRLEFAP